MRKIRRTISIMLCVVYAVISFGAYASMPSGLKDVVESGGNSEDISITILGANEYKIIESTNIKIKVDIHLVSSKSSAYIIEYSAGEKTYEPISFAVAPNTQITKEFTINGVNQGLQSICVNVYSENQLKKSLQQDYSIVTPAKDEFMDFYPTRGYNASYNTDQIRYYMDLQGVNSQRTAEEWNNLERSPGVYDYSPFDNWNSKVKPMGISTIYLLCYNNPLYNGVSPLVNIMSRQIGPKTKEEFDAFAKYAADFASKHKEIKYFEIYNEPNIAFWSPNPNVTDYTYLVEVTNREVKKVRPDASVVSGVVAGAQAKFIMDMYNRNVFPHTDSISYHPYIYPAKVDEIYQVSIDGIHNTILENGGFKEPIITEIGWATHEGGTGTPEDQQAIELVKQFVVADANGVNTNEVHHVKDTGLNKAYNEENFGLVRYDGTLKPAFMTVKTLIDETKGARYFGKLDLGKDIEAFMYLKNSEITGIIWSKGEATKCTLEGQNLKTYDMFGNANGSGDSINVTREPTYFKGLSLETLNKNAYKQMKNMVDSQMKVMQTRIDKGVCEKIVGIFDNALEPVKALENSAELMSEEQGFALLDNYYKDMVNGLKTVELSDTQLSSIYYITHLTAEVLSNYYMICADKNGEYTLTVQKKIDELTSKVSGNATYPYTEAILKFAQQFADKASKVGNTTEKNSMKTGIVKSWEQVASELVFLAENMLNVETAKCDKILLQLPSNEASVETNVKNTVNISLYNYTKDTINGVVELVAPDGKVASTSSKITLSSDKSLKVPMDIVINQVISKADASYKMRFVQDDKVLKEVVAPFVIKVGLDAKFQPLDKTFEQINELSLNINNLLDNALMGSIEVTPPEGWELSSSSGDISIDKKGSKTLLLGVNSKKKTPFNNYVFNVVVKNQNGNVIFDKKLPLSFSTVIKADGPYDTENFDGDISSWNNAYPVYFGNIDDVNSATNWSEADVASRVLTKWDDKNLYILADVYDNVHIQQRKSSQMWDGDCIQLSVDALNDKTDSYNDNDYEYGFSYSDENGNTAYSWQVASGKSAGDEDSKWVKILRDEKTKLSRYLICVPASELSPLKFNTGSAFGMNFAVNDADWGSRERMIEMVPGTAAAKKPSLYPSFVLCNTEKGGDAEINTPIPTKMNANSNNTSTDNKDTENNTEKFADISGHWAEDVINKMKGVGVVTGDENGNFNPDNAVTRGEFITMVVNVTKEKDMPYVKPYVDINQEDWFAEAVSFAKEKKLIDINMADMYYYPNREITRAEASSILSRCMDSHDVLVGDNIISLFEDGDEISEWAKNDMAKLYVNGIIEGYNKKLNPNNFITRAEAVVMMDRFMNGGN